MSTSSTQSFLATSSSHKNTKTWQMLPSNSLPSNSRHWVSEKITIAVESSVWIQHKKPDYSLLRDGFRVHNNRLFVNFATNSKAFSMMPGFLWSHCVVMSKHSNSFTPCSHDRQSFCCTVKIYRGYGVEACFSRGFTDGSSTKVPMCCFHGRLKPTRNLPVLPLPRPLQWIILLCWHLNIWLPTLPRTRQICPR